MAPLQLTTELWSKVALLWRPLSSPRIPGWRNRLLAECVAPGSLLQWGAEQLHVSKAVWENNPPKSRHIVRKFPNICFLLCILHHTLAAPGPVHSAGLYKPSTGHVSFPGKGPPAGLEGSYLELFPLRATPKPCWMKPLGGKWSESMVRGNLVPPDLHLPPMLQVWVREIEKPAVNHNIDCI